jgi:hypothetical protein
LIAEKVETGIKAERESLKTSGYDSEMALIDTGVLQLTKVIDLLKKKTF